MNISSGFCVTTRILSVLKTETEESLLDRCNVRWLQLSLLLLIIEGDSMPRNAKSL